MVYFDVNSWKPVADFVEPLSLLFNFSFVKVKGTLLHIFDVGMNCHTVRFVLDKTSMGPNLGSNVLKYAMEVVDKWFENISQCCIVMISRFA